jgi:prepilin signal peptidase PulO-like enzyme (type II secretory pathway)
MTWVHYAALAGFALALGGSVGSFLNVCIWRLPRGESVIRPRSRCPECRTPIESRDNVPVLGWLLLRGRCRHCAWPIPARYPLVEATVGVLFAGVVLADIALDPLDPLERGLPGVVARLAYHLALVALVVTVTMIARDERLGITPPPVAWAATGHIPFALLLLIAILGGVLASDLLGSALNALLLAVFVLRLPPARSQVGRVF